jgi:hypothetical protein
MVATLSPHPKKKDLRDLAGTLSQDEARAMQELIYTEFENIEGTW